MKSPYAVPGCSCPLCSGTHLLNSDGRVIPVKPELEKEHMYAGGIRLFRIWKLNADGKGLDAIARTWTWSPGINKCDEMPSISSSRSGFYGFNSCDQMRVQEQWGVPEDSDSLNIIGGTFISWGRIVTAEMGARVEIARIESIIEPAGMADKYLSILPSVADHYGIRIITEEQAKGLRIGLVPYQDGMDL